MHAVNPKYRIEEASLRQMVSAFKLRLRLALDLMCGATVFFVGLYTMHCEPVDSGVLFIHFNTIKSNFRAQEILESHPLWWREHCDQCVEQTPIVSVELV